MPHRIDYSMFTRIRLMTPAHRGASYSGEYYLVKPGLGVVGVLDYKQVTIPIVAVNALDYGGQAVYLTKGKPLHGDRLGYRGRELSPDLEPDELYSWCFREYVHGIEGVSRCLTE